MSPTARWMVAVLAAALVVCMLVWARGEEHHHGIQVGSLGSVARQTTATG